MSQIILETVKPVVVEKLRHLAQRHQRSLEAEITAILERATENEPIATPKNRGWSAGFFEDVIGGWEGEPLVREPQPEYIDANELLKANDLIADLLEEDKTSTTAFWAATLRFRQKIQQENIVFTDEDFAGLRDRSVGREVEL